MNRRQFLKIVALGSAAAALSGCIGSNGNQEEAAKVKSIRRREISNRVFLYFSSRICGPPRKKYNGLRNSSRPGGFWFSREK